MNEHTGAALWRLAVSVFLCGLIWFNFRTGTALWPSLLPSSSAKRKTEPFFYWLVQGALAVLVLVFLVRAYMWAFWHP